MTAPARAKDLPHAVPQIIEQQLAYDVWVSLSDLDNAGRVGAIAHALARWRQANEDDAEAMRNMAVPLYEALRDATGNVEEMGCTCMDRSSECNKHRGFHERGCVGWDRAEPYRKLLAKARGESEPQEPEPDYGAPNEAERAEMAARIQRELK